MAAVADSPVIAAVNGSHMDPVVVRTASLRARDTKATLVLLYVIEVEHSEPVESSREAHILEAERVIADAQRRSSPNGLTVRTEIKQARTAAAAIIDSALDEGAGVVVVGAHRFLGEHDCDLGPTATHVLRHAPVQVVVCYDPIR